MRKRRGRPLWYAPGPVHLGAQRRRSVWPRGVHQRPWAWPFWRGLGGFIVFGTTRVVSMGVELTLRVIRSHCITSRPILFMFTRRVLTVGAISALPRRQWSDFMIMPTYNAHHVACCLDRPTHPARPQLRPATRPSGSSPPTTGPTPPSSRPVSPPSSSLSGPLVT